jgi:hypothetical protein
VAGAVDTPVDPRAGVWIAEDIETVLARRWTSVVRRQAGRG